MERNALVAAEYGCYSNLFMLFSWSVLSPVLSIRMCGSWGLPGLFWRHTVTQSVFLLLFLPLVNFSFGG